MYELALSARKKILNNDACTYLAGSKKDNSEIRDLLVAEVGWPWANARRLLGRAFQRWGPIRVLARKSRRRRMAMPCEVLPAGRVPADQSCWKCMPSVTETTPTNMVKGTDP